MESSGLLRAVDPAATCSKQLLSWSGSTQGLQLSWYPSFSNVLWSLLCNLGFTFTASHSGFPGAPWRDYCLLCIAGFSSLLAGWLITVCVCVCVCVCVFVCIYIYTYHIPNTHIYTTHISLSLSHTHTHNTYKHITNTHITHTHTHTHTHVLLDVCWLRHTVTILFQSRGSWLQRSRESWGHPCWLSKANLKVLAILGGTC
jgi:hypothetical protein